MPGKARLTLCLSRFILIASLSALGLAPFFCLCPDSSDSSSCHFSPALGALPSFRCTLWGFISLSMPCQERLRGVLFQGVRRDPALPQHHHCPGWPWSHSDSLSPMAPSEKTSGWLNRTQIPSTPEAYNQCIHGESPMIHLKTDFPKCKLKKSNQNRTKLL